MNEFSSMTLSLETAGVSMSKLDVAVYRYETKTSTELLDDTKTEVKISDLTSGSGHTFDDLDPGTHYKFQFYYSGTDDYVSSIDAGRSNRVQLVPGEMVGPYDLVLKPGCVLTGVVRAAEDRKPIPGAEIRVQSDEIEKALTDEKGVYRQGRALGGVVLGRCVVRWEYAPLGESRYCWSSVKI